MAEGTDTVVAFAAQIVAAHASNNPVSADRLPSLINEVHRALAGAAQASAQPTAIEPAVPVKKSVFADYVVCLECGKRFSMLKRHLNTDHHMTPAEYREKWDLPIAYPLVSPNYAKVRSALAKEIGLGRMSAADRAQRHRKAKGRRRK